MQCSVQSLKETSITIYPLPLSLPLSVCLSAMLVSWLAALTLPGQVWAGWGVRPYLVLKITPQSSHQLLLSSSDKEDKCQPQCTDLQSLVFIYDNVYISISQFGIITVLKWANWALSWVAKPITMLGMSVTFCITEISQLLLINLLN